MINDYHMLSGLQKVAILFSVVGESLALSLVKGLSKTNIRKIRSTVREMESVSYLVKKRVMEEFYFGFLSEQFESSDKEDGPIQPFEFLKELNEEQLNALVENEDSPVIAMIMAQLEPDQRMKILDKVDPKIKGQILLELGSLEDIPLEAVIEVAARMKEKATYLPRTTEFSRGGGKEIAEIIGNMEAAEEEKYLQTLQNENPELYKEVKKYHLTFDDILEKFPDNVKRDLFNGIELDSLSLALKGLDKEIVDKIVESLPGKKQAMFEPVEGAVAKREVEGARKQVVVGAKKLADDGTINLEDMLSGGDMIE